jgi:hypothetical protein
MFNNSKPNIILLSDQTDAVTMTKTLGIHKLACGLRNAGFEVLVINHLHIFSIDEIKKILQQTVNHNTLFIGINSFYYQYTGDQDNCFTTVHKFNAIVYKTKQPGSYLPHGILYNSEIKNLIKKLNPNCKIVLGGNDARDLEYIKDYDYVIKGYADKSGVNLARHLAYGDKLNSSSRSVFGATIISDPVAQGYDFVGTPMQYTDDDIILPGEVLGIEISRGCIFRCTYCSYPLNGKKKNDFIKHEEVLYREFLDNYEKYGITRYTFSDDTFNDSRDKIEMIHRISKKLPFKLEYWAYIRGDLLAAHRDTVDLLVDSGLRACFMGIETMHPEAGKIIGKGGDRTKMIEMLDYLKNKYHDQISITGSFIFGLPEEPVDSMKETAQMLLNNTIKVDSFQIGALRINPHHAFLSEFDINYADYGYRIMDNTIVGLNINDGIVWENNYTNFLECVELVNSIQQQSEITGNNKIPGRMAFGIAGLDYNLEHVFNKKITEFNWHQAHIQKCKRAYKYKQKLFKHIDTSVGVSDLEFDVVCPHT